MSEQWYWCLRHEEVEPPERCRAEDRLGPYESREAAANWKERYAEREVQHEQAKDEWDREDEAWDAWPDDPDAGA